MKFVVFSSSRGTVFRSTLERIADGSLSIACIGLITDKADRLCVSIAQEYGLPYEVVPRTKGEDREAYDKKIERAYEKLLEASGTKAGDCIIALIGWMFILSAWFVEKYPKKIINVHPSLLPKHPGAHAHDLVLESGDTESGMTIHYVDAGLDSGEIIVQKKCSVLPDDTVDTLKARVQELEKEWYPKVLEDIGRKVTCHES